MFTNYYHHHIEKVFHLKSRLGRLYWHLIIQAFAVSLVSVFIPIYLLIIGFSLTKVFIFLLIEWTVFGLLAPLYGKIIHTIGLREVIFIRTPLFAAALLLLSFLRDNPFLQGFYYIIPVLIGFAGALYTLSITSLFARYVGKEHQGEKTGKFIAFPKMASMLGPVAGGIIAARFGFPILFLLTIIILLASVVPLSFVKKNIDHPRFHFSVFRRLTLNLKEFFFLGAYGIKGFVLFIILPIALYLNLRNVLSLGVLISALSLTGALFTIYVGRFADAHGIKKVIKFGAIVTTILFIAFGYLLQSDLFFYLSFVSGVVSVLVNVPYESHLYDRARRGRSPLEFLAFKEFSLFFGRLVLFGLILLVGARLDFAFYIGSVASFAFFFF